MLDYGRDVCGDLAIAGQREWLVTNGLGGYAMGTIAGLLSRAYHGLLIAAQAPPEAPGYPPAARTLLLAKLEETATYDGRRYQLFANRLVDANAAQRASSWPGEPFGKSQTLVRAADAIMVTPQGFEYLERFHLEGTTPVWTFALGDALLEKWVWMEQGANTTYVQYRLVRGRKPLRLALAALVNCRDHHGNTASGAGWQMQIEPLGQGLRITPLPSAPPFYVLAEGIQATPRHTWRQGHYLAVENYRGLPDVEAHLHAGDFSAELLPGQALTIVATTDAQASLDGGAALARRRAHEGRLLAWAGATAQGPAAGAAERAKEGVAQLVLAADQFVVERMLPDGSPGCSIIAGYPWFGDWGRDTMISLPGLVLATGRHDLARQILLTFSHFVDQGMLPNRFPDAGEKPEYNTVDATLWYFEAVRAYHAATGDDGLLRQLYPALQEIVDWHRRGARYNIKLDPTDGLIYAGRPDVQLTWMDAKVDDWVVTPRVGKPVEISALWYNGLRSLAAFARRLSRSEDAGAYDELARQTQAGFQRFWNEELGYCYDVLDGPDGDDPSLRPNQLFAVSLPHSPLSQAQQRAVVDACARDLLTSHGLRSLSPEHIDYHARYGGDRRTRDAAYHQGTVWGWLIGPFISAHLRVYDDPAAARSFLQPLLQHLNGHCIGSLSEIFDGDPPHTPRGCIAQAWTVAEVLRVTMAMMEREDG